VRKKLGYKSHNCSEEYSILYLGSGTNRKKKQARPFHRTPLLPCVWRCFGQLVSGGENFCEGGVEKPSDLGGLA